MFACLRSLQSEFQAKASASNGSSSGIQPTDGDTLFRTLCQVEHASTTTTGGDGQKCDRVLPMAAMESMAAAVAGSNNSSPLEHALGRASIAAHVIRCSGGAASAAHADATPSLLPAEEVHDEDVVMDPKLYDELQRSPFLRRLMGVNKTRDTKPSNGIHASSNNNNNNNNNNINTNNIHNHNNDVKGGKRSRETTPPHPTNRTEASASSTSPPPPPSLRNTNKNSFAFRVRLNTENNNNNNTRARSPLPPRQLLSDTAPTPHHTTTTTTTMMPETDTNAMAGKKSDVSAPAPSSHLKQMTLLPFAKSTHHATEQISTGASSSSSSSSAFRNFLGGCGPQFSEPPSSSTVVSASNTTKHSTGESLSSGAAAAAGGDSRHPSSRFGQHQQNVLPRATQPLWAQPPPPPPAQQVAHANSSPPPVSGGSNNSSGDFVTAAEQLQSDVKAGKASALNSSYLSRRSPALGLRRSGFQPPFQQQHNNNNTQQSTSGSSEVSTDAVLKSVVAKQQQQPNNKTSKKVSNGDDGGGGGDADPGEYPASLLLPDGSVPPILQPLDPKLVTQVAMEILEHGAGARQVGWEDIAGLEHAKSSVEEAIIWPLRRPDLFVGLRDPPRGLLLFGPPGTGKTMIARAIANRAQCTFLNISSSSLMSKWLGDGEKMVRCLFAVATVKQPSVIFIDEIDSLLSVRGEGEMDSVRRVKTEFLVQLDGVATDRGDRVLLIGATNRPDELDEAARRRMEKRLYIPLPDASARQELMRRLLSTLQASTTTGTGSNNGGDDAEKTTTTSADDGSDTTPTSPRRSVHTLSEEDFKALTELSGGYSGADLKQLCREAAMGPLRDMSMRELSEVESKDLRPIDRRDFNQAVRRIRPSVGASEVARYEDWNRQFGSFAEEEEEEEERDRNVK